jgi:hypothetical protein
MVSAIVKAKKPADARPFVDLSTPREVAVLANGCCGGSGCC